MNRLTSKRERRSRRIKSFKFKINPTTDRMRVVFNRTNRYLSAQIIDDKKQETVVAANTMEKELEKDFQDSRKNKEAAKKLAAVLAERAKQKGVTRVLLDRRGILYHGKVAEFADSLRENGMEL